MQHVLVYVIMLFHNSGHVYIIYVLDLVTETYMHEIFLNLILLCSCTYVFTSFWELLPLEKAYFLNTVHLHIICQLEQTLDKAFGGQGSKIVMWVQCIVNMLMLINTTHALTLPTEKKMKNPCLRLIWNFDWFHGFADQCVNLINSNKQPWLCSLNYWSSSLRDMAVSSSLPWAAVLSPCGWLSMWDAPERGLASRSGRGHMLSTETSTYIS